MAKFIIEISDEQIRDLHDPEKVKEQVSEENGALKALFNMMACSIISKELDKGISEFHISREKMGDAKEKLEYFDRNVGDICMLAHFAMPEDKKE